MVCELLAHEPVLRSKGITTLGYAARQKPPPPGRSLSDPGLCCRWRPHLQRLACTSAWRSGWQQPGQQPTTPTGRASIYCAAVTSGTGQRHAVARLAWNLRAGSGNSKCPHQAVGRHLIARIRRISLFAILPKRESWRKRDVLTTSMT